jgi:hypothetical protein
MELEIQSAKLVLSIVDKETGEIITREATLGDFKEVTKKASSSSRTKKPKDDGDPTPKITVLDGKWQLNNAAIKLTGFEPEMKLDIKFEKKGRTITPILCVDDKTGNRLTKTYTVSCRGSKRDNLIQYGEVFELIPHDKEGYFKLKGDVEQPEDDIIDVPEEISSPEELDEESFEEDTVDINNIEFDFD